MEKGDNNGSWASPSSSIPVIIEIPNRMNAYIIFTLIYLDFTFFKYRPLLMI